ncbi:hypothetical protein GETHPA_05360 [Geothrix rubra]|uniref:DUF2914 domain-containing protein n=1 Tax=Geothrix rubra TaxID=2927977 RepID=A0ABQ5Q313_9BACT|nr:DUF2914 domain-containing protein [Geothrix rubra]GLH69003.1 hypothetical protein GETHPA_05360 [Geothrix rubra]
MRIASLIPLVLPVALLAQAPAPKPKAEAAPAPEATSIRPHAEVKVGTAVEKMEVVGEATDFKVAAGTKLYAWTKVWNPGDSVTVVFSKGETSSKQELKVPHSPYRTNAYRTFRQGDGGSWTVKVLAADGTELGSAAFTVEIQ